MKKLVIKMSPEQLEAMLLAISELPPPKDRTPQAKAVTSIFDGVYTKLLKKQIDKRNEPANKPFSLKLKYYEAFALSEVLGKARQLIGDMPYESNVCLKITNQIQNQL